MSLDRLWADWRSDYVATAGTSEGCVICNLVNAEDDAEALVLERAPATITVMNLYPYGSGHLMVAPVRHVPSFLDLDDGETVALARAQRRALLAIDAAYHPEGANVGANLGRAAGAGVPGHLHVHVLPRWSGDTNFMTAIAETRVLPESLRVGYDKLKAVWPR
ncbi:MAG TPA: HIT domain-containing protein [Acidimicrobiia bacterium]|jgi:ATP adenylyltransferase|nr:HIT domain-containing protein [Acidimicrobiia bacterium]